MARLTLARRSLRVVSTLTWGRAVPILLALMMLSALAALTACGGSSETPTVVPTEETEGGATPTPTVEETAQEETVQVDQSYWHAGFMVTLGEARLTEGDFGGLAVEIEAMFENLGKTGNRPNSTLVLQSGGQDYTDSTLSQDIPFVSVGETADGLITFRVDEAFSFDDAVLVVGMPTNNQAMVPLTPGAGELVSLEPQEIPASGSATAGAVTVTLTGAELRADIPETQSELEAGHLVLRVFFSATPQAGIQLGQGTLVSDNVALKLPDGSSAAVRDDGVSGVNELLQGKEGTTITDLSARFDVPSPASGEYAFIIKGKYGASGAQVEAEAPLTVP
jgi:hypothetical protein